MIVFAGKNDDNEKMNDVWILDLIYWTWSEVKYQSEETVPVPRSGHSAILYDNKMMIFAGIFEITRELNDAYLFDIETKKWSILFKDSEQAEASPSKSIYLQGSNASPYLK